MTDDRPAQPGPPGDPPGDPPGGPPNPPNPPGGGPLEERVAVVEARQDDLPTKGDLAKGLAKTERRMSRKIDKVSERLTEKIDKVSERLTEKINEVSERLNEKLHRQVLIYLGVVGFAVGSLIAFQEWRDRGRQQQIEGVQNQIEGVQSQIQGVQNQIQGVQGQIQGMQQQINLLLEHLLGGGAARPKAPRGGEAPALAPGDAKPQPPPELQMPGDG